MPERFEDRLREAAERLGEARNLLITARPESLESCFPLLETALAGVRELPVAADARQKEQAAALNRGAFHLRRLAEQAAAFYLEAMGAGEMNTGLYSPPGAVRSGVPVRRLLVEA